MAGVVASAVSSSAPALGDVQLDSADVHGTLFAHGDTLKAGGSPMWTVASDRRLKTLHGDFALSTPSLMRLRVRVFQYNGKAGTPNHGRCYVGLLAQVSACAPRTHRPHL